MVQKRKLRYKNFNICQLVDKGKLKLQYLDEFKEAKKIHGNVTKKIEHEDKKCRLKNTDIINLVKPLEFENCLNNFIDIKKIKVKNNFSFEFIKNCCKFVEIENKNDNTRFFAILILDDYGLLMNDVEFNTNKNFVIINKEEICPYLVSFNMLKDEYSIEEIKELFNKYLESKKNNNKKLVKE